MNRRTLVVFAVATVAAFALTWATSEMGWTRDHDGRWYSIAADVGISEDVPAPFRNRPLTPLVAGVLRVPWGFVVVTSVALGVAVAAVDRLLRSMTTARVAWVGLAMFVTTRSVMQPVSVPFRVDAATLAFSAVTLVLMRERRWLPLVFVVPLAVANHELALVLLVPVLLTAWREKRIPDGVLVAVVSVGMWWVLHRSGVIPANERDSFLAESVRRESVGWNIRMYGSVLGAVVQHAWMGLGAAVLVAPLGWRRAPQLVRDAAWMLAPCAVLCLGATQWYRVLGPVVPVVVMLAACALTPEREEAPALERAGAV